MPSNLPEDFRDVEQSSIVGTDMQGYDLTHYVLAERLLQVEYASIRDQIRNEASSDTLTYILEGGFRGFHKYSSGEQWQEWKDGAEEKWYQLYADGELPWEPYEEEIFKDGIEAETEEEAERIVSAKVKELMYGGPYYTLTDEED